MKKIILILTFLLVLFSNSYCQENTIPIKNKFDLYLITGYRTALIDFNSGPVFGLSIYNPDFPFSLNLRYDFLITLGKLTAIDSTNLFISLSDKFEVIQFNSQSFYEIEYRWKMKNNSSFHLGTGVTWINLGNREKHIFNKDYGYLALSLSLKYKISWFMLEIKSDMALKNEYYYQYVEYYIPFPVSLGIIYRFKPRNND